MKKQIQHLLPEERWKRYTLFGVFFFVLFHVFIFAAHQFLVHRYDTLYAEATQEGALVEMPDDFQRAHESANQRGFFTRPDILTRETRVLQLGIRSLINQYRSDLYRMHDTIVGNIQSLRTIAEMSETFLFPLRQEVIAHADHLEAQLTADRTTPLDDLVTLSTTYVHRASTDFEKVKKDLILQDIQALQHEITFLDSIYRVSQDTVLSFDPRVFNKMYKESFTEGNKNMQTSDELGVSWATLSNLLDPYRIESKQIRRDARFKRADIVAEEAKKWTDKQPPAAPVPDIYDQIFVSLSEQMMYVYEDGDLILSTPITSGRKYYETISGTFKIYTKQRNKLMKSPFPDEHYELWVDYWLGFHPSGYGLHDSCNSKDCWRTVFGGQNYVYNGSHGCVNTPYNAVRFIYNWASVGTTVHIE